jgi:hypothetical protein
MARRADHDKPVHAAADDGQDNEFEMQDERGWAGQHGQRPANAEEKHYRPRKGGHEGRVDENRD